MWAFVLAALTLTAQARLYSLSQCDQSLKSSSCPPNPGFGGNVTFDFSVAATRSDFEKFWTLDPQTQSDWLTIDLKTEGKGAALKVIEPLHGPTLSSNKYLMFGRVDVKLQAAAGKGVITAIVLKSDSGNEIDWEMLGAYENQAQTNYFFDGKPIYNQYADTYGLDFSTTADFHTYSIEWTDKFLTFLIDEKKLKTWRNGDIPGEEWPQVPMQVKIGVWAVTEDSQPGEIEWAGGIPDWKNEAPFVAYYKTLEVQDYAAWCHGKEDGITYNWERGAKWEDVKVMGCERRAPHGFTPDHDPETASETAKSETTTASTKSDAAVSTTASRGSPTSTTATANAETNPANSDEEDVAVSLQFSSLNVCGIAMLWFLVI